MAFSDFRDREFVARELHCAKIMRHVQASAAPVFAPFVDRERPRGIDPFAERQSVVRDVIGFSPSASGAGGPVIRPKAM